MEFENEESMTKRVDYQFIITTLNKEYVDELVVCLARQGYAPYITEEGNVGITISDDDLTAVEHRKEQA